MQTWHEEDGADLLHQSLRNGSDSREPRSGRLLQAHRRPQLTFLEGYCEGHPDYAVACLREQLLAGNKVSLGDLGSFHVELACDGADTTDEFNAQKIKDVNVRWTPGLEFKNLRSVAEFNLVPSRKAQADAIEVIRNEETIQGLE